MRDLFRFYSQHRSLLSSVTDSSSELKPHAIQLRYVGVRQLSITSHRPPSGDADYNLAGFPYTVSYSDYDPDTKTITVWVRMELGQAETHQEEPSSHTAEPDDQDNDEDLPFHLIVEIAGFYTVDEEQFPLEHIDQWAETNAPVTLFPYLREHVFALTTRCGFRPAILPLVTVPTLRIQRIVAKDEI